MPPWESLQVPVCVVLGLVPGVYIAWANHRLRRVMDPAVLAERNMAVQCLLGKLIAWMGILGIVLGSGQWELVACGTMFLSVTLGCYPARRTLWGETAGLATYAGRALRSVLSQSGWWLLLVLGPIIVMRLHGPTTLKTALLVLALAVWAEGGSRLNMALLGARPLLDDDLLARFRQIAERSTTRMPQVLSAGWPGGTLANAWAMPGRRTYRVLFGQTLLDALEPGEIVAVFAHEQAHLEEFARGELRRLGWVVYGLIAGATAVAYLGDGVSYVPLVAVAWISVASMVFTDLRRHHRRHEASSDRRAVELCGDAEAYASALTKIHALQGLPPRWAADYERVASHPSLAQRLVAIRIAATPDAPVPLVAVTDPTEPGLVAVLDADGWRLWRGVHGAVEPDAAPTTGWLRAQFRYEELRALCLDGDGNKLIVQATDIHWSIPLGTDDALRVFAQLQRVGRRVGRRN